MHKGYGFVKYSDVAQANQAIASMNGHRIDGRAIAVRVAGKPPQPVVPPGPPAPPVRAYLGPSQGFNGYPPQQMQSGGTPGTAPPGSYMGAPVPWGPPPPPPYVAPPPPPPGSNIYTSFQPPPIPPYDIQYPSTQVAATGAPAQTFTSTESQESYSTGMQSLDNTLASNNIYGKSLVGMTPNLQPYPASSMGYPTYYTINPPPPPPPPDAENPPMPPPVPSVDQNPQSTYGADSEYEKFMVEMK